MKKSGLRKNFTNLKSSKTNISSKKHQILPSLKTKRSCSFTSSPNAFLSKIRYSVDPVARSPQLAVASFSNIQGVPVWLLQSLYHSRCLDLKIPVSSEQQKRFFSTCASNLQNRNIALSELGLGPQSAEVLVKILTECDDYAFLNLEGNSLGDQGAFLLGTYLAKSNQIVHLNLGSNEITSEGSRVFLELIKDQQSITSLDLSSGDNASRNRISGKSTETLRSILSTNNILTHLNLSGTLLCKDGLVLLSQGLKNNTTLLYLNLSANLISENLQLFFSAVSASNLIDLVLSNNKIYDCGPIAEALVSAKLEKLDLSKNFIADWSMLFEFLCNNTKLTHLSLANNKLVHLTNYALSTFLKANSTLETLNLSYCELTESFVACFGHCMGENTGLKTLLLANNKLGDTAITYIANGLAVNKKIRHLNLSWNRITNTGCLALVQGMKNNDTMKTLVLSNNCIKNKGTEELFQLMKTNLSLTNVNIDNNHNEPKYSRLISKACRDQSEKIAQSKIPQLKDRIRKMQTTKNDLEEVSVRIVTQRKLKRMHTTNLKKQIRKLKDIKAKESNKIGELYEEFHNLKQKSFLLAQELINLKREYISIDNKFAQEEQRLSLKNQAIEQELIVLETLRKKVRSDHEALKKAKEQAITVKEKEWKNELNSLEVAHCKLKLAYERKDGISKPQKKCSHKFAK